MRVTILQTDIQWGNRASNASAAWRMMEDTPGSDLYVLPEMWSTGFATDPAGMAEDDESSLMWMLLKARETGAAVCGSIAVEDRSQGTPKYCNRLYFVKPDGTVYHYDKRHLFSYGGEDSHYTSGTSRVIVEHCGMRWLLLTCYDLRFPVWSRNLGDYDGIIYVANWPSPRIGVWHLLLRARAIENQAIVVGANRTGSDPYCQYPGRSAIIDAKGRTLAQASDNRVCAVSADISLSDIRRFRQKFGVLDDRDEFEITI